MTVQITFDWRTIGLTTLGVVLGSIVGLVYGGVFGYLLLDILTQGEDIELGLSIFSTVFGIWGWTAGFIGGGVAGVLKANSEADRPPIGGTR